MFKAFTSFLFIFFLSFSSFANTRPEDKKYENLLRNLKIRDIFKKEWSFKKNKSKVIILNFWTTTCPHCKEELPSMQKLYEMYGRDKLEIIAFNGDFDNQKKNVKSFIKKFNLSFKIVLDEGEFFDLFNVEAIPVTLIFINNKLKKIVNGPFNFTSEDFIKEIN